MPGWDSFMSKNGDAQICMTSSSLQEDEKMEKPS